MTMKDAQKKLTQKVELVVFDFDGVFTDNSVLVDQNGIESVRCSRSDGFGLRRLDEVNVQYCILSSEINPVVSARAQKLNISVSQGHNDKLAVLMDIVRDKCINIKNVAYVGNDINDISCLKKVGFPIGVKDAFPEVIKVAKYITTRPGGYGAVREVCDLIYNSRKGVSEKI